MNSAHPPFSEDGHLHFWRQISAFRLLQFLQLVFRFMQFCENLIALLGILGTLMVACELIDLRSEMRDLHDGRSAGAWACMAVLLCGWGGIVVARRCKRAPEGPVRHAVRLR